MVDRLYTVLDQDVQREYTAGRNYVEMLIVHYQGPNNITGTVRIPFASATPEAVHNLIMGQLETHLQIANLGEM